MMGFTRWMIFPALILLVSTSFNAVDSSKEPLKVTKSIVLEWQTAGEHVMEYYPEDQLLHFTGAYAMPYTGLPQFHRSFPIPSGYNSIEVVLSDMMYERCSPAEEKFLSSCHSIASESEATAMIGSARSQSIAVVTVLPLRHNTGFNGYEKLKGFTIELILTKDQKEDEAIRSGRFATSSVLKEGSWYKLKVEEAGIYRITYQDLMDFGIDADNIDPKNIRIYGNGGGMLPEANNQFRYDDLMENAILVSGEDDGRFDPEDHILFYGQSPHKWKYIILGYFDLFNNLYSDHSFYFLTVHDEPGKRIASIPGPTANATHIVTDFTNYVAYADDNISLIESGKVWYADHFPDQLTREYHFPAPEKAENSSAHFRFDFAARSEALSHFAITINETHTDLVPVTPVNLGSQTYARTKKRSMTVPYESGDQFTVNLQYLRPDELSQGWLNYIILNYIQNLKKIEPQMHFRNITSVGTDNIAEFRIQNAGSAAIVWDVTHPLTPEIRTGSFFGSTFVFKAAADSVREYIVYDSELFLTPEFVGEVPHQNLHASPTADLVIVTHPLFREAAEDIADIHRSHDGMTVLITEPEPLYNEFSSGGQDVTAIRDFMKMLYDRYGESSPRYLLLLGDGSFDLKDRVPNNTNFIPTYQTTESWNTANSYVIEDYFGLLDDHEGLECFGMLDIGIGRIPAGTIHEANIAVEKIRQYIFESEKHGRWKKTICFVADDEDSNLHFEQADSLARNLERLHGNYDISKVYLDAYKQIQSPGGNKYPDVTLAINKQVENGAMLINYVGHGGPRGWAHERVLEIPDIRKWSNGPRFPVFLTASCEFTRFDDPAMMSGGEEVFFNPDGGAIALFTTTRLAYSSSNFAVNKLFFDHLFSRSDNELPRLGDLIRLSKPEGVSTTRNFMLLGDPALRMNYPDYTIAVTHINDTEISEPADTLSALRKITVKGEVTDISGNRVHGFDGILYPLVFDKASVYSTLANDPASMKAEFNTFDKIIFRGLTSVSKGEFEFTFVVPLDISAAPGNAKISLYAVSASLDRDAAGHLSGIVAGGFHPSPEPDNQGPEISLFMNDETFISGNQIDENPTLIAYLSDANGINHYGTSIGHDIVATLRSDNETKTILNNYFEPDIDSYTSGKIIYPYHTLSDGWYTLTLKAWDVYNNSSEATIQFLIDNASNLALAEVYTFPNPFSDQTSFTFKHNKPGNTFNIVLEIYDLSGRCVFSEHNFQASTGTDINTVYYTWNGTDHFGNMLGNGAYIFRINVQSENGTHSILAQKLIIAR